MNILLIEDNEGDIELTKIAFERGKLLSTLSVAHDGVEAMEYLIKHAKFDDALRPNLILLDLNMPRMGGKEFLNIIKRDEKLRSIPVVVLTSSDAPADIRECYENHANCYIIKPFDPEKFMGVPKLLENYWANLVQLPDKTRQM
jgi:CheY-like chemotaxis protein